MFEKLQLMLNTFTFDIISEQLFCLHTTYVLFLLERMLMKHLYNFLFLLMVLCLMCIHSQFPSLI